MSIKWQSLQASAANTPYRFVALSPMSKVLIDTGYSVLYQMFRWIGLEGSVTFEEQDEIKAALDKLVLEVEIPILIGAMFPYPGDSVPIGTLPCDGMEYEREIYPLLYAYLSGTDYIVDEDHFTTPTFPGRTVIMPDEDHEVYSEFGEFEVTLTEPQMPKHRHSYYPPVSNVDLETPGAPDIFAAGVPVLTSLTGEAGNDEPHNNTQPSVAFNWCIVTGVTLAAEIPPETGFILFPDSFEAPEDQVEDSAEVALGVRVTIAAPGTITHVRFYKIAGSAGEHIARIYSSGDVLLSTELFTGETSVGWQQMELSAPVDVSEGDTFTISVSFENGYFARTSHFFDEDYVSAPFTVIGETSGLYAYPEMGSWPRPSDVFNNSNYYVGCVFEED